MRLRIPKHVRRIPRAVAHSSGIMEWSDGEIARLHGSWIRQFLWMHRARVALSSVIIGVMFLASAALLTFAFDRFQVWVQEAHAEETVVVKVITKHEAWCVIHPRFPTCRVTTKVQR